MGWLSIHVTPAQKRDAALAALFAAGAQGVHEPGVRLVTHFGGETDVESVAAGVREADPGADVLVGRPVDTDWSEAWKSQLSVQTLGALQIAPPWLAAGMDPNSTIVVDPGM